MSEKLVLNPGSVSDQSAQLAPNHIHQSQWLTANPEHQTAELELTQTAELDKVVADDPLERLSKLPIGQHMLSNLASLKVATNPAEVVRNKYGYDNYDNLKFSSDDERLRSHLSIAADLLETVYQQSDQQTDDWDEDFAFEEDLKQQVASLSVENAKRAKWAEGDSQTAQDQLIAGLLIDRGRYPKSSIGHIVKQAIAGGLATELIEAVKDNSGLVLKDSYEIENGRQITTLAPILDRDKSLLELVVGRQLKTDGFNFDIGSELSPTETEQHIQSLRHEELVDASFSAEIGQRDPNLQKQVIKATIGYSKFSQDTISMPIAEMAKLRPDVFEDDLEELREIATNRDVGCQYRGNEWGVSGLDVAVLETWAAGYKDLAGQMLTASKAEVGSGRQNPDGQLSDRGELGRVVEYSKLKDDPDRASVVLDEISQHIEQRRADLFARVDQHLNNIADNNQLDKDTSEAISSWFKHTMSKNQIDNSTNPEYYVELATNLADKLVKIAEESDQLMLQNLLLKTDHQPSSRGLRELQVLQDDNLLKLMVDKDTGETMSTIFYRSHAEAQTATRLLTSQGFKEIIAGCRLNQAGSHPLEIIRDLKLDLRLTYDVDEIVSSFTDTGLIQMIGSDQLSQSWRSKLFCRITQHPDWAIPTAETLAAILEADNDCGLLRRLDQLPDMSTESLISKLLNCWPIEEIADNAKNLLLAIETIDIPAFNNNSYLQERIFSEVISPPKDQNYLEVAQRFTKLLTSPRPLWKNQYIISTEIMQIDPGQDRTNIHPISVLPKVEIDKSKLPPQYHFIDSIKGFRPIEVADLSEDNLRAILVDSENISDQQLQQFKASIPFNRLTADAKRQVYAYQLYETVQRTRSDSYKAEADERNRQRLQDDLPNILQTGDFIHSTSDHILGSVLQVGNLAGESRQLAAKTDSFPFNVDVSVVREVEPTPAQSINKTFSASFGNMSLIYDPNRSDWLQDKTVAANRRDGRAHSLVLGAIPATEISAIVLKAPTELELQQTSRLIVENGFYIPLYNGDGQLKLSPEAYDQLRSSYNIDGAKIDFVVDSRLDTERRLGSNDGSEYYLPTDQGLKRYYIKFGGARGRDNQDVNGVDHVWTEFLGDQLYRDYGLAVPDTKMVQIDGRIGKASKWLDANQPPTAELTGFADGCVMDAWTSNWDAVYNSANIVAINGASYRIDNGNALDLRAQGDRKQAKDWNQTVAELETGAGRQGLANGMRHMYPSLTPQDFKAQVDRLADKFPDDKIDQLVDSIRRSAADRDSLKQTLKARRDYIISNQDRIVTELSRPALQPVDRTPPEGLGVPTVIESLAA